MRRSSAGSWMLLVAGCQMPNPAFDGSGDSADSLAEDTGSDEIADESESSESGTSTSTTEGNDTESTEGTDTGPSCGNTETLCDGSCVDLHTDPLNCGECGTMCGEDQVCANGCLQTKQVFVTSVPYAASLGGLMNADGFCNLMAGAALLDGEFKAWLSTPNGSPATSFSKSGAYLRTDGVVVAKSWIELVDGLLDAPINLDQAGAPVLAIEFCGATTAVWSATTIDGAFVGEPNCMNWTVGLEAALGRVGDAQASDSKWTDVGDCTVSCAKPLPVYCFEQ